MDIRRALMIIATTDCYHLPVVAPCFLNNLDRFVAHRSGWETIGIITIFLGDPHQLHAKRLDWKRTTLAEQSLWHLVGNNFKDQRLLQHVCPRRKTDNWHLCYRVGAADTETATVVFLQNDSLQNGHLDYLASISDDADHFFQMARSDGQVVETIVKNKW